MEIVSTHVNATVAQVKRPPKRNYMHNQAGPFPKRSPGGKCHNWAGLFLQRSPGEETQEVCTYYAFHLTYFYISKL